MRESKLFNIFIFKALLELSQFALYLSFSLLSAKPKQKQPKQSKNKTDVTPRVQGLGSAAGPVPGLYQSLCRSYAASRPTGSKPKIVYKQY